MPCIAPRSRRDRCVTMTGATQDRVSSGRRMVPFVPFADQAMYLAHVAGGQHSVMQSVWRYRRAVDRERLLQFHNKLAHGRLARLLQPALLPFGRHQWVSPPPLSSSLAIVETPIAVAELRNWMDAQVELPLDPVLGPGWNLTMQPLEDGSTVISLVASHCIADGMAGLLAVREAALGECRPPAYPSATAKRSRAGLIAEMLQVVKDAPVTARALGRLAHVARGAQALRRSPTEVPTVAQDDRTVVFPTIFLRIPTMEWDEAAKGRGANRFTFLAAMTAAFGQALGRVHQNEVSLLIPVNQREGLADTSGNCATLATLKVPVDEPFRSLRALQRRLQETLVRVRREPDPIAGLLPLVPFVPKRAFRTAGSMAVGALSELPVTCSHLGVWPEEALQIDGTTADLFCCRGIDRGVSVHAIEGRQGVASLFSAIIPNFVVLNFVAYQPGVVTNSEQLRVLAEELLARYGLAGELFET